MLRNRLLSEAPFLSRSTTREAVNLPRLALSRRQWGGAGVLWLLMGVVALMLSWSAGPDDWWIHGLWCVAGIAVLAWFLARCLRRGLELVLMDHLVMFSLAFGLYFLVGASFMAFGDTAGVDTALLYYNVTAISTLQIDAANAIGFGIAIIVASLTSGNWSFRTARHASARLRNISPAISLASLLLLGLGGSLYAALFDFGLLDGVVPGVARAVGQFVLVGIFLAASYRGSFQKLFRLLAVLLAAVLVAQGILLFNKTIVLLALGALIGGSARVYRPRLVLALGGLLIGLTYVSLTGIVTHSRNTLGIKGLYTLQQRLDVVVEGAQIGVSGEDDASSSAWSRLCYIPAQAAGMDLYDEGSGDNEFSLISWVLIPRVLAPEKPIMTQVGEDLNRKITGQDASWAGLGVFVSGYYSGGWVGLFAASALAGWILSQTSAVAAAVIGSGATILFPLGLIGLFTAFRIDGDFLGDYIGAFAFLFYPMLAFSIARAANSTTRRANQFDCTDRVLP